MDSPREAQTYWTQLCHGDVIVAYVRLVFLVPCVTTAHSLSQTDGLSDNVFPHELAEICSLDPEAGESDDAQAQSMADRLVIHARECMAAKSRVSPFERTPRRHYFDSVSETDRRNQGKQRGRECSFQAA